MATRRSARPARSTRSARSARSRRSTRKARSLRSQARPARPKTTRAGPRRLPVTPEDLTALKFVRGGALSPDGSRYVFPVESAREDLKGYNGHLHMAGTADGGVRQLTHGKRKDGGPVFSPDGGSIAFISKRGRYPGIQLLALDGGEARTLVEKDGAFSDLAFSPDGRRILCCFRANDPPEDGAGEKERKRAAADDEGARRVPPVYRHIDRLHYKQDGVGFLPKAEPQIWLYDIPSGKGVQLTRGPRGAQQPAFSPDGKRIVFVMNVRPNPYLEQDWTDLFLVSVRGGRPRRIPTPPGLAVSPSFSPDGKWVAYLGHDDLPGREYENPRVWVVPTGGGRPARCLCRGFDQPAYDATISDMGSAGFDLKPAWSPDGRSIFFISCSRGSSAIFRVPSRGGDPVRITPERIHLSAVAVARDGRMAAGVVSTPTMPPEVFAFDLRSRAHRRLTAFNRAWAAARALQKPKHCRVLSADKTAVDAWILTPPRFSPRKKYPAIVEVHGGPQTQYGYAFFHELQMLASSGFVVIYGNPRGSVGYGRAFCEAIHADWGNRDYQDVMAITDCLAELPYVDPRRIGITGGSYGGYMTTWAIGHTRRFRAAVAQRAATDLEQLFGCSDIGFSVRHVFGAYPWEDHAGYRRQSPLTYAPAIRTPLLIIHSEGDLRCSIGQAETLFVTLKVLGRRVEFIRFPEESHGLSRGGRPDRRIVRLQKIREWFARYL